MEKKLSLPKYIRLSIYSYLTTKEIFASIALLSTYERSILPESELIGARDIHIKLNKDQERAQ